MRSRSWVQIGDDVIEFVVRRSDRRKKTVQITVDGDDVVVAAPTHLTQDELEGMVLGRAKWILGRLNAQQLARSPLRFATGETLPYLGRRVPIVVHKKAAGFAVRFDHWRFRVSVPQSAGVSQRYDSIRDGIVQWYGARAAVRLREVVRHWWDLLGHGGEPRILIRDQRRRWGSCAADGTLRFNWRVMMLDPSLIEYIVVHELAHLSHMNHSREYWSFVTEVMPDAQQRRQRLREVGGTLPL